MSENESMKDFATNSEDVERRSFLKEKKKSKVTALSVPDLKSASLLLTPIF